MVDNDNSSIFIDLYWLTFFIWLFAANDFKSINEFQFIFIGNQKDHENSKIQLLFFFCFFSQT